MFTLTINQTDSRRDGDRVPQLLKDLRHIPARLDFDRSVEDEVQGIVDSAHQAVEAAMILRAQAISSSVGPKAAFAASICFGWIRVLPSNPSSRP